MYLPAHSGMGALPLCSTVTTAPGFVGPVDCDPSSGPVNYPASQSQIASIWQAIDEQGATPAAPSSEGFGPWLTANALNIGIGLGVSALVLGLMKR